MTTILIPLCTIAALCSNPTQTTRFSNNVTSLGYQIVAGSNFTIQSTNPSTSSQSIIDVNTNTTWTCSGTTCSMPNIWTASSIIGSNQTFRSNNAQLIVSVVGPVPSQPSIMALINGNNAQYQLAPSEYTYESPLSACLLTYAPTSLRYDGLDVPNQWSSLWNASTGVLSRNFTNVNVNTTITESWSILNVQAGLPYDYHFVCYNGNGKSVRSSLYNFVGVANNNQAPSTFDVDIIDYNTLAIRFALPPAMIGRVTADNWSFRNATIRIGYPGFTQSNFSIVVSNDYLMAQANRSNPLEPGQIMMVNSKYNIDLRYASQWEFEVSTYASAISQKARVSKSFVIPPASPHLAISVHSVVPFAAQNVTLYTRNGNSRVATALVNSSLLLTISGAAPSQVTVYRVLQSMNESLGSPVTNDSWTTFLGSNIAPNTLLTFGASAMNGSVRVESVDSIMVVLPVPTQASFDRVGDKMVLRPSAQFYNSSIRGCVLTWGRTSISYEAADLPADWATLAATNRTSTQYFLVGANITQSHEVNFSSIIESVYANVALDYHFVCYNSYGHSIKTSKYNIVTAATLPIPAIRNSSSSSSAAPAVRSSSSAFGALSSSSGANSLSSSSQGGVLLSSSSGSVMLSSSSAAPVLVSSSAQMVNMSSTGAAGKSSSGARSSSGAGSSSGIANADSSSSATTNMPAGTTSITFRVELTGTTIPPALAEALSDDVAAMLSKLFKVLPGLIKRFILVKITPGTTGRRLLQSSISVEVIILGDINTVSGVSGSAADITAQMSGSIQSGSFEAPSTAALGVSVPVQQPVVNIVTPDASSTGFNDPNDSSSSGISTGAIVGIVIGVIAGVVLLTVAGLVAYRKCSHAKIAAAHSMPLVKEATTIAVRGGR